LTYWMDGGTLIGAVRHKGFIPWDDDVDVCMFREDYEKIAELLEKELPSEYSLGTKYNHNGFTCNWHRILYKDDFRWVTQEGVEGQGLFLDIFPVDKTSCSLKLRKFEKKVGNGLCKWAYQVDKKTLKDWGKHIAHHLRPIKLWKIYSKLVHTEKDPMYGVSIETYFYDAKEVYHKSEILPIVELEFEGYKFYGPRDWDKYLKVRFGDYMTMPTVEERAKAVHSTNMKLIGEDR
ncbi:MAG: LicD family protein, partial [Clostridium sp.]